MGTWHSYLSINISYKFTAINNVNRSTAIHTFHVIGIYPLNIMPPTSHMYVPLHYSCSLHINSNVTGHTTTKCNFKLLWYFHICANNKHALQMLHTSQIWKLVLVKIWGNYVSKYTSCELTTINNVTRHTATHTFHIIDIYLWTNMPATAYLLYSTYRPTLLHIVT